MTRHGDFETLDGTITMDGAGRIVVPKAIRGAAGIRPGAPLVIRFRDGRIEIETPARSVRITRKGRVAVALPVDGPAEALEERKVRETRAALRGGR